MTLLRENDTIAAISTPIGPGGIGVVRVSGDLAQKMFSMLFRPSSPVTEPESHRMYHGWFVDPESGDAVDEVLAVLMRAPRSYTREDVIEIQCHSGPAILSRILDACIMSGARLADPGEFTRRAFMNGRIDLVQAEAVAEIASARSNSAGRLAVAQLQGRLSDRVNEIRHALKGCLASIEAAIDYPEEELEVADGLYVTAQELSQGVIQPLRQLLSEFERGRIFRHGAWALIAGRPNVGKSSLLNALLCEDRAIVTSIPGTTRDPVEAELQIGGMLVRFTDTAGIRPDPDPVEAIGIDKVREMFSSADVVLWLLDAGEAPCRDDLEVGSLIRENKRFDNTVMVFSKTDLVPSVEQAVEGNLESLRRHFPEVDSCQVVPLSSVTGQGLETLERAVAAKIMESAGNEPPEVAINARHRDVLARALQAAEQGLECMEAGMSPEITAIELRAVLTDLSEVTGDGVTEEVLDHLFATFCLGK